MERAGRGLSCLSLLVYNARILFVNQCAVSCSSGSSSSSSSSRVFV